MFIRDCALLVTAALFTTHRQSSASIDWKPFVYTSIAGDSIPADSARVSVPENRTRSTGRTIQVAVVRLRSTSATPGAPIVYLAGGPGSGAITGVRGDLYPMMSALRSVSDIILFDQRGTGLTLPSLGTRRTIGAPLDVSSSAPEARAALLGNSRAAREEVSARGIDLTAYNTNESADDIDDLRTALGTDKIIVWGHSYGSHLGLTYIRRHPEHVERAILGGINGTDHRRRMPKDADVLFARLDSTVKASPSLRAVMPDFLGTTRRVLDRLGKEPVKVVVDSQTVLVSREDVAAVIAIQSGEQAYVRRLPQMIGAMDVGNYTSVARQVRDVIKSRPLGTVMTYMMDLASGVSEQRARTIREQIPTALLGNAINYPFDDAEFQAVWNSPDLGPSFRAPIRTAIPTLFISGTLDGRTSLGDAEDIRKGFSKNAHVVITGASHNPYALTAELRDAMLRFAKGEMVKSVVLNAPHVELRSPDEAQLLDELKAMRMKDGFLAAVEGLRAAAKPGSGHHVTSALVNEMVISAAREDRAMAAQVLAVGLELFPWSSPLLTRRAEGEAASGNRAAALATFRAALAADPFNQVAEIQIRRLAAMP